MCYFNLHKRYSILLLLCSLLSPACYANHKSTLSSSHGSASATLSTITQHIQAIQTDLKAATIKKEHLQKALKKTEIVESHLTTQLHKTKKKLSQQHYLLSHLDEKAHQLSEKIDTHQSMLIKQIQLSYFFSRQPAIKYLLDTQSLQQYQRTAVYFDYLAHAQLQTITSMQTTLNAYQETKHAREKTFKTLLAIQNKQLANQHLLKQTQVVRHQLIDRINHHIKTKREKLALLIQNKIQLEKTLADLNKRQLEQSLFEHPFASLRGKLSWPVNGRLMQHYGAQISQSELTWDGVLIEAPAGKPVYAAASGKVIFAKWLEGYGLLLIIDHGNGYMTLYGRNQSLQKKVGDWVKSNMIIATVGQTGGFEKSALYFSIRHNAKPLDPEKWCLNASQKLKKAL